MSDAARTILIVTDDQAFSAPISELMLRAGARTLRFASSRDALDMTRAIAPDLVLLHVPSEQLKTEWAAYAGLWADMATSAIPILMYTQQFEQERAVGAAAPYMPEHSDQILARMSMLVSGSGRNKHRPDDGYIQQFPTGRDDL
jgi:DNA-binding response OmpR family regulator